MRDLYLKFKDEAEARSVLFRDEPEVKDEEGAVIREGYSAPRYVNTDVIGTITKPPAEEGAEPVALEGFHVNVRLMDDEDGAILAPYEIEVAHPVRTWA